MGQHGGTLLGEPHGGLLLDGGIKQLVLILTLLFWSVCLVFHFSATVYNMKLYAKALPYLLFSKDSKWKNPPDSGGADILEAEKTPANVQRRRVIFVRHGESTWNEAFNPAGIKHKLLAPFTLLYSFTTEAYLLMTGMRDSWFYDSPLNKLGQRQADELRGFLADFNTKAQKKDSALYNPDAHKEPSFDDCCLMAGLVPSVMVSSNLRRAVATMGIAFWDRLRSGKGEKIHWLPHCQEISRNPDTMSISPPFSAFSDIKAKPSWMDLHARELGSQVDLQVVYDDMCDLKLNTGNKSSKGNGLERMLAFNAWVFDQELPVIVGGHSIWFRSFFRTFLPVDCSAHGVAENAKAKKVKNGGAVALDLLCVEVNGEMRYKVDPSSVQAVYMGFM